MNDLRLNTEKIAELERGNIERLRGLSLKERGDLLTLACETAAEIEASKLRMGLPPSKPAPWPASTWEFLAQSARRARQQ